MENADAIRAEKEPQSDEQSILGLSTADLAGLSVKDLTGNETAIRMMLHYYRVLTRDNAVLKNDNNTLKTYVEAYDRQKSNGATGAILLFVSNVSIAFGVNLLTSGTSASGWISLGSGVVMALAGLYFSFRKDRSG